MKSHTGYGRGDGCSIYGQLHIRAGYGYCFVVRLECLVTYGCCKSAENKMCEEKEEKNAYKKNNNKIWNYVDGCVFGIDSWGEDICRRYS